MNTLFVVNGGDAPGINTLMGHYCALAAENGDGVLGAHTGFPGLLEDDIGQLTYDGLMAWMGRGGCMLSTSRDPVLTQPGARERLRAVLEGRGVDNMVLFGGNGTLRHIPPLLSEWNIACIGVPTTIDNDVSGTELTLGFDSACNFACYSLDGVLATAHALRGRMFMVETLGGTCGCLALEIAAAAGAHAVIVPEYDYDEDWLAERLMQKIARHGFALFIICEGAHGARTLADTLPQRTGIRIRDVRLGHAQRGATPSHRDRALAADMARVAYRTLKAGGGSATLVVRDEQVTTHEGRLPDGPVVPNRAVYDRINDL